MSYAVIKMAFTKLYLCGKSPLRNEITWLYLIVKSHFINKLEIKHAEDNANYGKDILKNQTMFEISFLFISSWSNRSYPSRI